MSYIFLRLIRSMPNRCRDCVSTRGGHTSYIAFDNKQCYPVWKSNDHDRICPDTLVCWRWFTLRSSYVKIKFANFVFASNALSNKLIELNVTTIWRDFSQYIYKYMVLKFCSLKYFEQCTYIHFVQRLQPEYCFSKMEISGTRNHNFAKFKIKKYTLK